MKTVVEQQTSPRIWSLGAVAVLFSIASAFLYFLHLAQAFAFSDWLDIPGREADAAIAHHRATYWLMASLFCLTCSTATTTLLLPFFAEASRVARLIGRFVLASVFSTVLTGLIGLLAFTIISIFSSRSVQ
jgi:hypothetical protein